MKQVRKKRGTKVWTNRIQYELRVRLKEYVFNFIQIQYSIMDSFRLSSVYLPFIGGDDGNDASDDGGTIPPSFYDQLQHVAAHHRQLAPSHIVCSRTLVYLYFISEKK